MNDLHNPFQIIDNRLSNIEKLIREIKNAPKEDYSIRYYTKQEVAELINRSTQTIKNYHDKGWIKIEDQGPRCKLIHHYQIFNEDNTLRKFPPKINAK